MSSKRNGFWKQCRVVVMWTLVMLGASVWSGGSPSVVEAQEEGETYTALAIIWCDLDDGCEVTGYRCVSPCYDDAPFTIPCCYFSGE